MKLTEEFKEAGTARLDGKNRVTLGGILKKYKALTSASIDDFEAYIGDSGDILLRPRTAIPTRELWIHKHPEVLKSIREGLRDAGAGRVTKVKNIDKFFDEL